MFLIGRFIETNPFQTGLGNPTIFSKYRFINGNRFMPSEWNTGILGIQTEINHFNCKKLLQTHHSIAPLFLPREAFFYFTGAVIPIGASVKFLFISF
jgi:hypothetical protein